MKYLAKLSIVSFIYSLFFYVIFYSAKYPFKFEKVFGFPVIESYFYLLFPLAVIFISAIFLPIITNKWLEGRLHSLWITILWIPFFVILYIVIPIILPFLYQAIDPLSEVFEQHNYKGNGVFIILACITLTLFNLAIITLSILIRMKKKMAQANIV